MGHPSASRPVVSIIIWIRTFVRVIFGWVLGGGDTPPGTAAGSTEVEDGGEIVKVEEGGGIR